jgi:hypothetical protein
LGNGWRGDANYVDHLRDVRHLARCLDAQAARGDTVAGTLGCPDRETVWVIEAANMLDTPLW